MTGETIYAIGDIHGHLAPFEDLLGQIEHDAQGAPHRIVCIGDYIDRGPESRQVIDRVMHLPEGSVALRGNHEQSMIDILDEPFDCEYLYLWDYWGGHATLESYGVGPLVDREGSANFFKALRGTVPNAAAAHMDRDRASKLVTDFRAAVSPEQREFLRALKLSFETATHFFCHAAVDFARPLARQMPDVLLYQRLPFITDERMAEKIIVHGHTITEDFLPAVRPNRIGIDTGAYKSGRLTAAVLAPGAPPRFIMTS